MPQNYSHRGLCKSNAYYMSRVKGPNIRGWWYVFMRDYGEREGRVQLLVIGTKSIKVPLGLCGQ